MVEKPDQNKSNDAKQDNTAAKPGVDEHVSQQQLGTSKALEILTGKAGGSKTATLGSVELFDSSVDTGRVVSRQNYSPKPGETIKDICTRAMGPGATPEQVRQFTERFLKENNLKDANAPLARLTVVIPEHTYIGKEALHGARPAQPEKPQPEKPTLTQKQIDAMAKAIDSAANGGLTGIGTDKEAINEQLKKLKNQADRDALDAAYKKLTNHGIEDELKDELSGSDLTRSMELWKGSNTDSARIAVGLEEHKEWGWSARSNNIIEKDLRDTISTMNSQQIEKLDQDYRKQHGVGVREALLNDKNLPKATKDALEIYLKGTDKRTPEDTLKLADLAMQSRNLDMFQEAFRDASSEARKKFIENNGKDRIVDAFGTPQGGDSVAQTNTENEDTAHALEYVTAGKLSTATKVGANTGSINDNEEAIELSLKQMTPEERNSYMEGKKLSEAGTTNLTEVQRKDLEAYNKLHAALTKAGDEREVAKWEDLIKFKDGSLVSKLAAHGGIIDDGMNKVLRTVEDMSEDDWKRLKDDPEQLKEVRRVLSIDLSDAEMKRVNELIDKKLASGSFKDSGAQQRSILETLEDESGVVNDDEEGVLEALKRMTPAEQKKYTEDAEFRKQVDDKVKSIMDDGNELKSAQALLESVARGEDPANNIVSKLREHAGHFDTDEAKVVSDFEESLSKDPKLKERLKNDPAYRKEVDDALRAALDPEEYERYGKPLMENGRVPMELKAELYKGSFNDDEKAFFEAVKKGSEEDWKELLAAPETTMPFLSVEEREVALNIARQKGKMQPEDRIRAAMLGAGTDVTEIKEVLKELKEGEIDTVKQAYLDKYGADMLFDMMDETGGSDRNKLVNQTRDKAADSRTAFNQTREDVYQSVDGIGRSFVDGIDGTADMTLDNLNQYAAGISKYATDYKEMSPEEHKKYQEQLTEALDLFKESKSSAANTVVDGAIIAAGILGAKFTGGVSLSLLAYTSIGGALFKVGAKSAIMGSDYDFASSQVVTDSATGAIDAATIFLGPAQAAQMLKLGERSAGTAARTVIAQLDDVARASGRQVLTDGAEDTLQKKIYEQVAFAISNGSDTVDSKAISKIAKSVAASADDAPKVEKLIAAGLGEAVRAEAANATRTTMRELALNSAAGNVGGGLSGAVYGGAEWDPSKTLEQNLAAVGTATMSGAAMGTGMAGGMTLAFKGIGRGLGALAKGEPRTGVPDNLASGGKPDVSSPHRAGTTDAGQLARSSHTQYEPAPVVGQNSMPDAAPIVGGNGTPEVSPVREAPIVRVGQEVPARGGTPVDFAPGDYVLYNGERAFLHSVDETTGRLVIHSPERAGWAVKLSDGKDLSGYERITIDGKPYLATSDGNVYSEITFNENKLLMPANQYQLVPLQAKVEKAPYSIGQPVRHDGQTSYIAGFNTTTGDAILRHPERANYARAFGRRVETFDQYSKVEFGENVMWLDANGRLWEEMSRGPNGNPMIMQVFEYSVVKQSDIKALTPTEIEALSKKKYAATDDGASPPELQDVEKPRAEAPKIPRGDVVGTNRNFHPTEVYDGAQLTLGGQTIGELKPGVEIELGRGKLGLTDSKISRNHGTIRWDAEEQMFYLDEHSTNGTLIKRAGQSEYQELPGGSKQPYKVYIGPHDSLKLGSINSPELKLQVPGGEHLKPGAGPTGEVDVRIFFDGQPLHFNKDGELLIGRQHQQFGNNNPTDILNRRVASNHAKLRWDEQAQQWELTDLTGAKKASASPRPAVEGTVYVGKGAGNGTYVRRSDGKIDFVQGTATHIGPNDRVHLGSPDGPELKFITNQGQRQIDGRVITPRKNYDQAIARPDGTTEITNFLRFKRLEDPYGRVIQTMDPDGNKVRFSYDDSGNLKKIKFDDGSAAEQSGDMWMRTTGDGRAELYWRGEIDVQENGAVRFIDNGKPPKITIEHPDGVREIVHPNGRIEFDNVDFRKELAYLNEISHTFPTREQGMRFKALMTSFEMQAQRNGLSVQEKAQTFLQIRRLMSAEYGAFLTAPERSNLAEQILLLAGDPKLVSQGRNSTCNVATVEHRMFARKPSEAAKLITDVVITGKYVTADGTTIDLARIPGVLAPDFESRALQKAFDPTNMKDLWKDGSRSYASQIFETAAVNINWARSSEYHYGKGDLVIYQKPSGPPTAATKEQLVRYSVDYNGTLQSSILSDSPHLTADKLTGIYNQIAGSTDNHFVMRHANMPAGPNYDGTLIVKSPKDLQQAIEKMKADGSGPGILVVHTRNEPFWHDSGKGGAGGSGGWHVVNIQGVRTDARGRVVVDLTNQWGQPYNHLGDKAVPIEQLYEATIDPTSRIAARVEPPKPPDVIPPKQPEKKGLFNWFFGDQKPRDGGMQDLAPNTEAGVSAAARSDVPSLQRSGADAYHAAIKSNLEPIEPGSGKGRQMVNPQRDVSKLSPSEVAQLMRQAEPVRSYLNSGIVGRDFSERLVPWINTWKDLSYVAKRNQDAYTEYVNSTSIYQTMLNSTPDLPPYAYNQSEVAAEFFKDQPEKLQILTKYLDSRAKYNLVYQELDALTTARKEELQDIVNKFARENELPPVEIRIRNKEHMGSSKASYDEGEIIINRDDLVSKKSGASLIGSVYHELTHAEQDAKIIRAIADRMQVGRDFRAVEIDVVQAAYHDLVGRNPDRSFINRVLVMRSKLETMELPEVELARADALAEAWRLNQPVGRMWLETADDFRVTNGAFKKMNSSNPNAILDLLKNMHRDDGTMTSANFNRHLFGTPEPPENFTRYWQEFRRYQSGRDSDAWDSATARKARAELTAALDARLQDINARRQDAYDSYMQLHEIDAFLSGERARMEALNLGAGSGETVGAADGIKFVNTEVDNLRRASLDQIDDKAKDHPDHHSGADKSGANQSGENRQASDDAARRAAEDAELEAINTPKLTTAENVRILETRPANEWDDDDIWEFMLHWNEYTIPQKELFLSQFHGINDDNKSALSFVDLLGGSNQKTVLDLLDANPDSVPPSMKAWHEMHQLKHGQRYRSAVTLSNSQMGRRSIQYLEEFALNPEMNVSHPNYGADKRRLQSELQKAMSDKLFNHASEDDIFIFERGDIEVLADSIEPGNKELLADLDAYKQRSQAIFDEIERIDRVVEEQRLILQTFVDEQSEKIGIPSPRVSFDEEEKFLGSFAVGYNGLNLRTDLLGRPGKMASTIAHELTHGEQYALVIRSLAEEHGISRHPSPADLERLQEIIYQQINRQTETDYLKEVLQRQVVQISEVDKKRAAELIDSFKNFADGEDVTKKMESMVRRLDTFEGSIEAGLPARYLDLKMVEPALFNGLPMPPMLRDLYDAAVKGDEEAQSKLYDALRHYASSARKQWSNEKYSLYFNRRHELEAHAVSNELDFVIQSRRTGST